MDSYMILEFLGPARRVVFSLAMALHIMLECPLSAPAQQRMPQKHALLVAVSGYARGKPGDVEELHTGRDVQMIRSLLTQPRYHFTQVKVLQSSKETTKQAILTTFRKHLIEPCQPGDIIYFHYSGHGATIKNPNDEVYGSDQTLVPSDYISKQDASNDIHDFEIAPLLQELRNKRPGSVVLTFDSCHSEGITRGDGPVRGFNRDASKVAVVRHSTMERKGWLLGSGEIARLGYVVFTACRADQGSHEKWVDGKLMGPLSFAFSQALATAPPQATYRDLYTHITSVLSEIAPGQDPQCLGLLDTVLFRDTRRTPQRSIAVMLLDNRQLVLRAGSLWGIAKGTRVDIYPSGPLSANRNKRIGVAVVTQVESTLSRLELQQGLYRPSAENLKNAQAVITHRVYPDEPLRVRADAIKNHPAYPMIGKALALFQTDRLIVQVAANAPWDLQIMPLQAAEPLVRQAQRHPLPQEKPTDLVVMRSNGSLLLFQKEQPTRSKPAGVYGQSFDCSEQKVRDTLLEAIRRETRRRMLLRLPGSNTTNDYRVELRIIPCEATLDARGYYQYKRDKESAQTGNGLLSLRIGDTYCIQLRNVGRKPAYVNIVSLANGDGSVSMLLPGLEESSVAVPAKREWQFLQTKAGEKKVYIVAGPVGQETLLLLATQKQQDYRDLVDRNSYDARGSYIGNRDHPAESDSPLGKLLKSLYPRRGPLDTEIPAEGYTVSVHHHLVLPAKAAP